VFAVGAIAFSFSLAVVVFPAAVNLLLMRRRRSWPTADSRGGEATRPQWIDRCRSCLHAVFMLGRAVRPRANRLRKSCENRRSGGVDG
jgi:hypothetical protein